MTEKDQDSILDLPEDRQPKPKRFDNLIMASLVLLGLGILMKTFYYPGYFIAIVLGATGLTLAYLLRFIYSPEKSLYSLLQLLFGGALLVAIILSRFGIVWSSLLTRFAIWLLIPILLIALYSYFTKR